MASKAFTCFHKNKLNIQHIHIIYILLTYTCDPCILREKPLAHRLRPSRQWWSFSSQRPTTSHVQVSINVLTSPIANLFKMVKKPYKNMSSPLFPKTSFPPFPQPLAASGHLPSHRSIRQVLLGYQARPLGGPGLLLLFQRIGISRLGLR